MEVWETRRKCETRTIQGDAHGFMCFSFCFIFKNFWTGVTGFYWIIFGRKMIYGWSKVSPFFNGDSSIYTMFNLIEQHFNLQNRIFSITR